MKPLPKLPSGSGARCSHLIGGIEQAILQDDNVTATYRAAMALAAVAIEAAEHVERYPEVDMAHRRQEILTYYGLQGRYE